MCMSHSCTLCMASFNSSEPPVPLFLIWKKRVRMLCYGDNIIKNIGWIKIREEISEIEDIKINREKSANPKVGSWKISTKLTNFQLDWPRKKSEKTQVTKIWNESGDITINSTEIKSIMKEYNEQLYVHYLENLDEMHIFLNKLTKLT